MAGKGGRVRLGALLDQAGQAPEEEVSAVVPEPAPAPEQAEPVDAAPAPEKPAPRAASRRPQPAAETPAATAATGPRYQAFERKEARLWEGQHDELTMLARRLNKRRKGGERITENTLIRIGVTWLLANAERLEGSTEDELRASLGLADRA